MKLRMGSMPAQVTRLTDDLFAAADPQVSFDGARVLFSGQRKSAGPWQVWEMNADGTGKRQLTDCATNCLRPAYLPSDEIVFTVVDLQDGRVSSHLAVSGGDGSPLRRITFAPGDFQVETVLRDGRIVASASWPLMDDTNSRQLYTLRPDGTALEAFRCEHGRSSVQGQAVELEDGSVVFVGSSPESDPPGGRLVEVRRGAAYGSPLGPEQILAWSPREIAAGKLLVARRMSSTPGANGRLDLYAFDLKSQTIGARVYADPYMSSLQAVPVELRPTPKIFWSLVHPEAKAGYFICLDSRLSSYGPNGQFSSLIASVRVLTLDSKNGKDQRLGEAPVEKDGSFYVAVPADQPTRFELLDGKGQIIQAQRGWVWARPGEQRGCPGCHQDQALAPENRWPLTLRRFDTPTPLGIVVEAPPVQGAN